MRKSAMFESMRHYCMKASLVLIMQGMTLPVLAAPNSMGQVVYAKPSKVSAYGTRFSGHVMGDTVILRRQEGAYCFGKDSNQPSATNECSNGQAMETTTYSVPVGVTKHHLTGFCWGGSCSGHPQTYDVNVAVSGSVATVTISVGTHFSLTQAATLDFTLEDGKAIPYPWPPNATSKVPHSRPALIFTELDDLAKAREWFKKTYPIETPFSPREEELDEIAFGFLMTGDEVYGEAVRKWLSDPGLWKNIEESRKSVASNELRWEGERAALICDWVPINNEFCEPWTGLMLEESAKNWGGPHMAANNYFWSGVRNDIEFGLTNFSLDPERNQNLLDEALERRYRDSFLPFSLSGAKGGVLAEGFQYGRYQLGYSSIPYWSMQRYGRDIYSENRFFKEAVYYLSYLITPRPTINIIPVLGENESFTRERIQAHYRYFPYNDDEFFSFAALEDVRYDLEKNLGKFLISAANEWANEPAGQLARQMINAYKIPIPSYLKALDSGGVAKKFSSLPLDYYAAGTSYLFSRNSWSPTATSIFLQLSSPTGVGGHAHLDSGTFQIWKNGRWLSRESTAYSEPFVDFEGVGTVGSEFPIAHNTVLINGLGPINDPSAVLTRLESSSEYSFASVDLTASYQPHDEDANIRQFQWNHNVSRVVRDFIFIRPFETLLVYDRLRSIGHPTQIPDAAQVPKTFITHFETKPTIQDANHVLYSAGTQSLSLTTLYPAQHAYKLIDEAVVYRNDPENPNDTLHVSPGQFRLEDTTKGSADSYFIHTLQARDKSTANLTTSIKETPVAFMITLSHPSKGTAVVRLNKGMVSRGGRFGYAANGVPSTKPLLEGIEGFEVLDSGPRWSILD